MRPSVLTFALAIPLACLCGCGSSGSSTSGNGLASHTPAQIFTEAKAAAASASSAHVAGTLSSGGETITLNLDLAAGKGGQGQISENGLSFELIETGGYVYIKGSPAFYTHIAGPATAQLFQGKWLKAPATSGNFASLANLTNLHLLISMALAEHGTLAKGAAATVEGVPAIAIDDTSKGGTLYVARSGEPYPVRIAKQGSGGGQISFTRWNEHIFITAPSHAVDLTQLQSAG